MLATDNSRFDPLVEVLMTPRPITIDPFATVGAAAALMRTCRVRHLPVVSNGLAGVLSLRDVVAADERALVGHVMTRKPQSAGRTTTLTSACERMLAGRFSCLPVLGNDGALVGIFTATDALRFTSGVLDDDARANRRAPDVVQVMTARPLVTVAPTTTLASAWRLMETSSVRHLPVLTDGSVVGLLSDRDVLAAGREWMQEGAAERQPVMLVADAMSTRVSTIDPGRPASDAASTLLRRRIGALPVVRGTQLRGIITVSDFMYWILGRA